jgi:protein-disulfide isomerase
MTRFHHKDWLTTPLSIVIAGSLIALSIVIGTWLIAAKLVPAQRNVPLTPPAGAPADLSKMRPISSKDHILGSPNANVFVVEYSDTECPFCKKHHPVLHQVIDKYGKDGSVAWVYRHFPLKSHSKAKKEAEATECAAELGGNEMFWKYLDRIYEITPSNNGLDPAELPEIATLLGLNKTAFEKCLSSGRYAEKVAADEAEAVAIGAGGTPHNVVISGTKSEVLKGAATFASFEAAIQGMLK